MKELLDEVTHALAHARQRVDGVDGEYVELPRGLAVVLQPDGSGCIYDTAREVFPGWSRGHFGPGERYPDALEAWLDQQQYQPTDEERAASWAARQAQEEDAERVRQWYANDPALASNRWQGDAGVEYAWRARRQDAYLWDKFGRG